MDTAPVQVFTGTTILSAKASITEAKAAIAAREIAGDTLVIETTDSDDDIFHIICGMSIQAALGFPCETDEDVGGDDILTCLGINYLLFGGLGDNMLIGNVGRNILTGGAGADMFVLANMPANAATYDAIKDFNALVGAIVSRGGTVLTALGLMVDADEIVIGTEALQADEFLIFDAGSGKHSYDADGRGAGEPQQIALFDDVTTLTEADCLILWPVRNGIGDAPRQAHSTLGIPRITATSW
ncbi:hypothetical protein [Novosphingobium sp. BW1]|uniref:hypothetical protein n=1 Tax=Novosphingobium sp. BW1 TaxID=2592621 RepID=UPI0011DEAACD|nr:hypothetical protein [Novosphingobium sp. BW1]TYC90469.1 hypothetical protein FMM79_07280 [Novosphingobium sp. BW1]